MKKILHKKTRTRIKKLPEKKIFVEHLRELRFRFFLSFGFFLVGSIFGYLIQDKILFVLTRPLNQTLYFTSPAGGFNFALGLSLFFGFIVFLPVFILQTLKFVEPVIPEKARFSFVFLILGASCLMIFGMSFAYFVSLPAALHFLGEFSSANVKSLISTDEYLSFVTRYLIGFGLFFQLPLAMVFINKIVVLSVRRLMTYQKFVLLGAFIVAAIVTPTPDFLNQLMMAAPLIVLYQFSILLVWGINRTRNDKLPEGT